MNKRKWFFGSQCLIAYALIFVLLVSLFGAVGTQAWSSDPTENTAICTASQDQQSPVVVGDGSGGAIIAWRDYRSGTYYDIYAQRLNPSGVPQWTANGVAICTASYDQGQPGELGVVSDGSGGAIITWNDYRSGNNYDIYAQRVNPSGVPQWTTNGIAVCTASDYQGRPAVISDGSGGAIITWEDDRSGSSDIYAQRVNPSGIPQWTANGVAICTVSNYQQACGMVGDGSGGAIITWRDGRSGTYNDLFDIYAQRVNPSGVPQWTANGVAICTAAGHQYDPAVVSDGSGNAIIIWEDYRNSPSTKGIYAQRVNPSGVPQWTSNGVAISTTADNQHEPALVSDGSGGAIITWENDCGLYSDIYAQRVNPSGVPQWTTYGVAICVTSDNHYNPAIVSDGSGGAIITWENHRSPYGGICAQRVNPSGVPQWTANGIAIGVASGDQRDPALVGDGSGGAIITWEDHRGSIYDGDIYAQRVNADGLLNGIVPTITPTPTPTLPPSGIHTWSFCTAGFYPQHMPDSFTSEVVLGDLNPSAIPPEVQGVYWYDCSTSDWKFWAPGVPGTTLTTLGGGHTYDYMVSVTDACAWEIPLP